LLDYHHSCEQSKNSQQQTISYPILPASREYLSIPKVQYNYCHTKPSTLYYYQLELLHILTHCRFEPMTCAWRTICFKNCWRPVLCALKKAVSLLLVLLCTWCKTAAAFQASTSLNLFKNFLRY
jgi:hypothetical protein